MKEYQPKKNNPYYLPTTLYMRAVYLIRDYDRLKQEYENLPWESPKPLDGQPRGTGIANPTEQKAIRRAVMLDEMKAIEQAERVIPEEYRRQVFENTKDKKPYPMGASYSTWRRYRQKFIWQVAKNMCWI